MQKQKKVMVRQRDVLLVKMADGETSPIPSDTDPMLTKSGRVVIAEGESTGHAHTLTATKSAGYLFEGQMVIVVSEPDTLSHQEHAGIELLPGTYFVVGQREYHPLETKRVID